MDAVFFFSKTGLLLDYVICFVSPGMSVGLVGLCNKIMVNLVLLAVVAVDIDLLGDLNRRFCSPD